MSETVWVIAGLIMWVPLWAVAWKCKCAKLSHMSMDFGTDDYIDRERLHWGSAESVAFIVADGTQVREWMVYSPLPWRRRLSLIHPLRKWRKTAYPPDSKAVHEYLYDKWGIEPIRYPPEMTAS